MSEILDSPITPAEKKKKPAWLIALWALTGVALLLACTYGVNLLTLNVTYDLPFFVNGMSMYPTINAGGLRYSEEGYRLLSWDDNESRSGDIIDYGLGKSVGHGNWIDSLQRNDIVVTYYPRDYVKDSSGEYSRDAQGKLILKSGATPKIKRLIALPNEHFEYEIVRPEEGESDISSPVYGKTKVGLPGQEAYLKPLYDLSYFGPTERSSGYTYPAYSYSWAKQSNTYILDLGEDEYLAAGDNRGASSDCLSERFTITKEMIQGKAFLLVGSCEFSASSAGNTIKPNYGYTFTPWAYRRIG